MSDHSPWHAAFGGLRTLDIDLRIMKRFKVCFDNSSAINALYQKLTFGVSLLHSLKYFLPA